MKIVIVWLGLCVMNDVIILYKIYLLHTMQNKCHICHVYKVFHLPVFFYPDWSIGDESLTHSIVYAMH